mmetsp:Transcript_1739/g.5236  ORF Transcript_1739/g.5236 Transcript_1739/m.5236 type:complete len:139 (-) Transcript_1739:8-424(-)
MGGGNAQKSAAAREKNMKAKGKTAEERAASKAKAEKDKCGFKCLICMQTFLVSATPKQLFTHVTSKHDKLTATPEQCFACLKGFDPNAAHTKKEAGALATAQAAAKKKVEGAKAKKKKDGDLSELLTAGLAGVGKKKK